MGTGRVGLRRFGKKPPSAEVDVDDKSLKTWHPPNRPFFLYQYCVLICMHRMALVFLLFCHNMEQASLPISSPSVYVLCVCACVRASWLGEDERKEERLFSLRFASWVWVPASQSVTLSRTKSVYIPSAWAVDELGGNGWATPRRPRPTVNDIG